MLFTKNDLYEDTTVQNDTEKGETYECCYEQAKFQKMKDRVRTNEFVIDVVHKFRQVQSSHTPCNMQCPEKDRHRCNRWWSQLQQAHKKNRCIGLAMSSIPTFPLLFLPSGFSPIRWWRLASVWSFSLAVVSALLIPIVSFAVVSALLVPIISPVALCLLPGAVSLISIVLSVQSSGAFVLQCMWIDSDPREANANL